MRIPLPHFSGSSCTCAVLAILIACLPSGAAPVINEIHYFAPPPNLNAPEEPDEEFIELHNPGGSAVVLTNWAFDRGITFTFPAGTSIPPGGYLVVVRNPTAFSNRHPTVPNVIGGWTGQLSNSGEKIRLVDAAAAVVDEVSYSDEGEWGQRYLTFSGNASGWEWGAPADGNGPSLELINPALTRDSGQNWAPSQIPGGTPGAANTNAAQDIAPLILNVSHSPAVPLPSDPIVVHAEVHDDHPAAGVTATLLWRPSDLQSLPIASIPMSSTDGVHFSASIPPQPTGTVIEFAVSALDNANNPPGNHLTRFWPVEPSPNPRLPLALLQVDEETYSGPGGFYRLIFSPVELDLFSNISGGSNAQMNVTLIADGGTGPQVRYFCGLRRRGDGSRGASPPNPVRVNIPHDNALNDETELNLGSVYTWNQYIGMKLMGASGLPAPDVKRVKVRYNGTNPDSGLGRLAGYYVHVQPLNGEWAAAHLPDDSGGNLYKKAAPNQVNSNWAYRNGNAGSYRSDGWEKQTNQSAQDYSDLDNLLRIFNTQATSPTFIEQAQAVVNIDQMLRWFAVEALLINRETNIASGFDEDYSIYRGVNDPRFIFLPHDLDTVLNQGDTTTTMPAAAQRTVFDMIQDGNAMGTLTPFFTNPQIIDRYYAQFRDLIQTSFSKPRFDALLDSQLGDWIDAAIIAQMKAFMDARRAYIEGLVNARLGPPPPLPSPANVASVTRPRGPVFLSEVLASNLTALNHEGSRPDYIEIRNTGATDVDASDMSLTDDPTAPLKYVIPAGTTIPAGGYLIIFADTAATSGLHAQFALRDGGETIQLFASPASGGELLDSLTFGLQAPDLSIGRTGPGLDEWTLTAPSPGAENAPITLGTPAPLRINEWIGQPDVRFNDDLVELYNAQDSPVALGGMIFMDAVGGGLSPHRLPDLSFMAPRGFAVFQCEGTSADPGRADELPFRLSAASGWISLAAANGVFIDLVSYQSMRPDGSRGRFPDGAASQFDLPLATPGYPNYYLPTSVNPEFPFSSQWFYWAEPGAPVSGWKEIDYGATWPSGPGLLGVESTVLSEPRRTSLPLNPPTTHYFRRFFTTDGPINGEFRFSVFVDDGAVVYLNGQEIRRIRMPSGPISHGTLANASVQDSSLEGPFLVPPGLIRSNGNVFAVEVHQQSTDSSDVIFGLRLDSVGYTSPSPAFLNANRLLDQLRITEIMYNPPGSQDREFIELRNIGSEPIDLGGVRLTGGVEFAFPPMTLTGGQYVIVVANVAAFEAAYGTGFPIAGAWTGSLSNTGEELALQLPTPFGGAVLNFAYSDAWEPSTDGLGSSLTFREPDADYHDWLIPGRWAGHAPTPAAHPAPVITSPLVATANARLQFDYIIAADFQPESFGASNLPAGLSVDSVTGLISGTPESPGDYAIGLSATNVGGTGNAVLQLHVDPIPPPVITSLLTATANIGVDFSYQITATNLPDSFEATGLPAGFAVDPVTGLITGTTTAIGDFDVTIRAINSTGAGTAVLALTVQNDPLAEGVDNPFLVFTSGGNQPWIPSPFDFHDGEDSLISGTINSGQQSWMETKVTGPDVINFWWRASVYSFPSGANRLVVLVDGVPRTSLTTYTDWILESIDIPEGSHTVRWLLDVTTEDNGPYNQGFLDQVYLDSDPRPVITDTIDWQIEQGVPFSRQIETHQPADEFLAADLPPGLTIDPVTGLIEGTATENGFFATRVEARNAAGSSSVWLRFRITPRLADALDNQDLTWTSSGSATWYGTFTDTHDTVDAGRSGVPPNAGQSSTLSTTVTGPGKLVFWWQVRTFGEQSSLQFRIDNTVNRTIIDETQWQRIDVAIGPGQHTLSWTYTQQYDFDSDYYGGFVDSVQFITGPGPVITSPEFVNVTRGFFLSYSITTITPATIFSAIGLPPGANFNPTTGRITGSLNQLGTYEATITATNDSGSYSQPLVITVLPTFIDAIDEPRLTWTHGGGAQWTGNTARSHDGSHSARSGDIGDGGESWCQTTVVGPGTLSFWWRIESEGSFDFLRLLVDGNQQSSIDGAVDWTAVTLPIPAGTHTLRWRYSKDGSVSIGEDAGWIDEIRYVPSTYAGWAALEGLTSANNSMMADPDADSQSNLMEYASGGSPRKADRARAPLMSVDSQGYLTLSADKTASATDLTYSVERTTDLGGWSTNGTVVAEDNALRLRVRSATPIAAGPREWLRLKVAPK